MQLPRRDFRQRIGLTRLAESCVNSEAEDIRWDQLFCSCSTDWPGSREYIPPDPDQNHGGLSTVMTEVKSLAVDPQRRMRAIAQAEKARDKQLTDRKGNNEFAADAGWLRRAEEAQEDSYGLLLLV